LCAEERDQIFDRLHAAGQRILLCVSRRATDPARHSEEHVHVHVVWIESQVLDELIRGAQRKTRMRATQLVLDLLVDRTNDPRVGL